MKVSIIVTNFNYGKYIDRCIRSCLNQNYSVGLKNLKKDFEVIVVDDCSKDNSREKNKRFNKVKNFRYIFNNKNMGFLLVRIKRYLCLKVNILFV